MVLAPPGMTWPKRVMVGLVCQSGSDRPAQVSWAGSARSSPAVYHHASDGVCRQPPCWTQHSLCHRVSSALMFHHIGSLSFELSLLLASLMALLAVASQQNGPNFTTAVHYTAARNCSRQCPVSGVIIVLGVVISI